MEKILVVDDEDRIRDLLLDTLKAKGFLTIPARNGEEALQVFIEHRPTLVITDLMLPRLDGFMLVDKIRERDDGREVPILMMSAVYRDLKVRRRIDGIYGVEFLVKPFSLVDLIQKIRFLLSLTDSGTKEASAKAKVTGRLEHFSAPLLLISFFSEEKTGLLQLQSGNRILKIYFRQGLPVFAEGRTRKTDEATVHELFRSLLGWSSGEYSFETLATLPADLPQFQAKPYALLYEGARRYYRLDLLLPQFQQVQALPVTRLHGFDERIAELGFGAPELKIVKQIDGSRTVNDLVTLGSSQIENVFQILWILQFLNVVRLGTEGKP